MSLPQFRVLGSTLNLELHGLVFNTSNYMRQDQTYSFRFFFLFRVEGEFLLLLLVYSFVEKKISAFFRKIRSHVSLELFGL